MNGLVINAPRISAKPAQQNVCDETAASPTVRMQTMERLIQLFRRAAGETSTMSLEEFKKASEIKTHAFASRMFKAIDADGNGALTCEEFVNFFYTLQCNDFRGRIKVLFDLYDIDQSGSLSSYELECILMESVCESNASMDKTLVGFLANSIMEAFDTDCSGDISFEEFVQAMSKYPDIAMGLTIKGSGMVTGDDCSFQDGIWACIKCYCHKYYNTAANNPERTVSCVVLIIILASAFWWRVYLYLDGPKYELMGWTLPVAKGCGQMIKVLYALILFPVSRHFMTWVRRTPLKYVFPLDDAIDAHKILGTLAFIFAWIHSLCHVNDIIRWGDPARFEVWKRAFPNETSQPTRYEITTSQVGITGILQLVLFTIVFITASNWPRRTKWIQESFFGKVMNNFNFIWYMHHLVLVLLALIMMHPKPHIPDEKNEWGYSDVWAWIGIPIAVYLLERLVRTFQRFKSVEVLSAEILPGKVIALKLSKPRNLAFKTGMFIYINVPAIAQFEWHPFSLTSPTNACHLNVHIKVCGDWTEALYNRVKRCSGVTSRCTNENEIVQQLSEVRSARTEVLPAVSCPGSPLVWQPSASPRLGRFIGEGSMTNALYDGMINKKFVALPESVTGKPVSPRVNNPTKQPIQGHRGGTIPSPRTPRQSSHPDMTDSLYKCAAENNAQRKDSFAVDLSHVPSSPRPPELEGGCSSLTLKIDGPFGAPVQGFKEHSVLLLVGAGIGVTPFAGILSDLVYRIRQSKSTGQPGSNVLIPGLPKLQKVYFYWSVRSQSEVVWFSRCLEAISKDDTLGILDINVHLTGLKDTKDVRTALLKLVQVSTHGSTGVDVMSGLKSRVLTHFGRPSWECVFKNVQAMHPKQTVGVFYSGPNTLARILRGLSQKYSNQGSRFKFVKEAFGHW